MPRMFSARMIWIGRESELSVNKIIYCLRLIKPSLVLDGELFLLVLWVISVHLVHILTSNILYTQALKMKKEEYEVNFAWKGSSCPPCCPHPDTKSSIDYIFGLLQKTVGYRIIESMLKYALE